MPRGVHKNTIRDVEFRGLLQQKPRIALKVLEALAGRLPREGV